jgi:putative oxidoreductase
MHALSLSPLSRASPFAPLVLRVVVGGVMLAHGIQKWFQIGPAEFGRGPIEESLGLPAPELLGYLVATSEVVFGALLIVGLLTRIAAIALGGILVVAVLGVKLGNVGLIAGMDAMGPGYELDLALLGGLLALVLMGAGALSLDRALGIEPSADRAPARGAVA